MSNTKRYESATGMERLQIQQADRLSQESYNFFHDPHPIAIFTRLLMAIGVTSLVTAFIQVCGNPPILIMAAIVAHMAVLLAFWWQYKERWHRGSFTACLWVGFAFAMDWNNVAAWLGAIGR